VYREEDKTYPLFTPPTPQTPLKGGKGGQLAGKSKEIFDFFLPNLNPLYFPPDPLEGG